MSNTKGTIVSTHKEDQILALFPKSIKDFILYDCVHDIDIRGVAELLVEREPVDSILNMLRSYNRNETKKEYGWRHPQSGRYI